MKHLLLFLFAISTLSLNAQTQKGYVKTKGRMNSAGKVIPGKRLAGAVISVKGKNAVTTNGSGSFTLKLSGNNYVLSNVRKQGYELTDIDALSKQYTYSAQNPHIIVMETSADKIDEQLMIEEKTRANLNKRIKKQQTEIAKLKAENKITQEEYRKLMLQLNEERNSNEKLIQDMVERYSKIDYDQLDAFNQEINRFILEGELTKADSMLNTKGDINARVKEYQKGQELINEEQRKLDHAKKVSQKELNELAEDCRKKFEIFFLQHQRDSAAYYIELRAKLDTTNADWQLNAANYLSDFAQHEKALSYYRKTLTLVKELYGEKNAATAYCYNRMGFVYNSQDKYALAMEFFNKALAERIEIHGEEHPNVAGSYMALGVVYRKLGNYKQAIENFKKSLNISLKIHGEKNADVAMSYITLGMTYASQLDFKKALEYYNKAFDIQKEIYTKENLFLSLTYMHLGIAHNVQGNYEKAKEFLEKTLDIQQKIYDDKHPNIAACHITLGFLYHYRNMDMKPKQYDFNHFMTTSKNYDRALEHYNKAQEILLEVYGPNHSDVANCYCCIGVLYHSLGDNEKALDYCNKALEIYRGIYKEEDHHITDIKKTIKQIETQLNKK